MLADFQSQLTRTGLLKPGDRIVVGYSGGADSGCLLHLLKQSGYEVIAAHLHHGQRQAADKELKLCELQCNDWGIPFVSGKADVPTMSKHLKVGIEEAGRLARYNFLSQVKTRFEFDFIATAHTGTESIETAIFNMIRGTGPHGFTGIPAARDNIVRPLLNFTRSQTRQYCADNNIWFHDDPNNDELEFSRARIRHRILPEFATINPEFESAISRLLTIVDEEDQFLNGAAAAALEQCELQLNGELAFLTRDIEIAFDRQRLESLPPVLLKRAMRLAFDFFGTPLNYDQTQLLAELFATRQNGSITPEGGTTVGELSDDRLHIRILQPTEPFRFKLTIPGETESETFGWTITAFESTPTKHQNTRQALQVEIDLDKVTGELYFRSAQSGDAMNPLGFEGTRKLSDLLSESHLTPAARTRLPIICDFVGPIWAPGVCLSNKIRKEETTSRVLVLNFKPL